MPTISWTESSPADGDNAGLGDDAFRSLKSAVRVGLDGEHVWPSAGGDAGVHRLGSARPYFGAQSAVSSTGTDARLMVTSDTSRLFHVGSGGTMFLGGQNVPSIGSAAAGGSSQFLRHIWIEELGYEVGVSSGAVAFPRSGFSGVPFTLLTTHAEDSVAGFAHAQLTSTSATGFTYRIATHTGLDGSACTLYWRSIGSRVL